MLKLLKSLRVTQFVQEKHAGTLEAAAEMYPAEAMTSKEEMFIHFILNERARELMGEFHRWVDLSRTKTLLQSAKAFNPKATPDIKEKHLLRPIPQAHIDALQKERRLLTAEKKAQYKTPAIDHRMYAGI